MTAKIDIKTPAGKSLEGFPIEANPDNGTQQLFTLLPNNKVDVSTFSDDNIIQLHKGDIISIEIL